MPKKTAPKLHQESTLQPFGADAKNRAANWVGTSIGWNTVDAAPGSILFEGVENDRFYFVHSYGVQNWQLEAMGAFIPPKVSWSEYGSRFVAACEVGPLAATQFHPEKSGEAGIRLLTNWVNSL